MLRRPALLKDALSPPGSNEYAPYYAHSISCVPKGDVLELLAHQREDVAALGSLSEEQASYRYAPDKWSVKEVIGHLSDTEWVFAYRILRFARGDKTPLPGFEQDAFVAASNFDKRPIGEVVKEFVAVRVASLMLVHSLEPDVLLQRGVANHAEITVRAIIYLMAGHTAHHLRVLQERYGVSA